MRFLIIIALILSQSFAIKAQDWEPLGDVNIKLLRNPKFNTQVYENHLYYGGSSQVNGEYSIFSKWDGKDWTLLDSLIPFKFRDASDNQSLKSVHDGILFTKHASFGNQNPRGSFYYDPINDTILTLIERAVNISPWIVHEKIGEQYFYLTNLRNVDEGEWEVFVLDSDTMKPLNLRTDCVSGSLILKSVNDKLFINADTLTFDGSCKGYGPSYYENGKWIKLGGRNDAYTKDFTFYKGKYYTSGTVANNGSPDPGWQVQVFDSVMLPLPGDPVEQWISIGHPDLKAVRQLEVYKGFLYAVNVTCASCPSDKIYRYDGENWGVFKDVSNVKYVKEDTYAPGVEQIKFMKDEMYVYGSFDSIDNQAIRGIARTKVLNAVNTAPIAQNDSLFLAEDKKASITLTQNDADGEGDYIITQIFTNAAHGLTTLDGDEKLTYTPNPNFNGKDSLQYEAFDRGGLKDSAWVFIEVQAVEDAIICKNDSLTLDEDNSLIVDVIQNDLDVDSRISMVEIIGGPQHGTANVGGDLQITYTPEENYWGEDSLVYLACDQLGQGCDTATVFIQVNSINDKPLSENDNFTTSDTGIYLINILANDFDEEDQQPAKGLAIIVPSKINEATIKNLQLKYYRTTKEASIDSLTYKVCDADGSCDTALVVINNEEVIFSSVQTRNLSVVISPNPVSSQLQLTFPKGITAKEFWVYDVFGRMMKSYTLNEEKIVISVDCLPAGTYFLRVDGLVPTPFIKL
ncbi:MAG: hypothetical protein ACJATA_002003 [Sphingobacteriales bacterium]|jgi:hypothetical protein